MCIYGDLIANLRVIFSHFFVDVNFVWVNRYPLSKVWVNLSSPHCPKVWILPCIRGLRGCKILGWCKFRNYPGRFFGRCSMQMHDGAGGWGSVWQLWCYDGEGEGGGGWVKNWPHRSFHSLTKTYHFWTRECFLQVLERI